MEKIIILDFGSQYTQLIARRVREQNVYCEIHPYWHIPTLDETVKGLILSGSPFSVHQENAPMPDLQQFRGKIPLLGICYGAQLLVHQNGGKVVRSQIREYGRAFLKVAETNELINEAADASQVWMSHGDSITEMPKGFELIATTENIPVAAFQIKNEKTYGLQFHPEVTHSASGSAILGNFLRTVCGCKGAWTANSFIDETTENLKKQLGNDKIVLALSGGVDSSVAAILLHRAAGEKLYCIFVDNGLLRKDEYAQVLKIYEGLGLNVKGVDAKERFYSQLSGVSDPEQKRKIIGRVFIEVFDEEARLIKDVKWLAQGTIYPDVIESVSVKGPSATIKSHHNVGGLPEKMNLKVVEPLRTLFKDEVRRVGRALGLSENILQRHPFPGPGLAIRILGDITPQKVALLQEADDIYINLLRKHNLYGDVWQAGAILLPINSVGVMGDERTYEQVVALRAVGSTDGMTADWSHLPYQFLAEVSNEIINRVKGINRVVYDISSKPPATIEWE